MSIPQGHDAVTQDDPMARMRKMIMDVGLMTTTVVCHPDDVLRVQAAIDRTEFPGLFRLVSMPWVDAGTMLVFDSAQLWPEQA